MGDFNYVGQVIASLRKSKGITQEELGKKVDINRASIVKIENGQRALSLEEAANISNVLEVSLDTLYDQVSSGTSESNFVMAFRTKGMTEKDLEEIDIVEALIDVLFTQEKIYRGE